MKTLVIYATKHGCTEKAANLLRQKLFGEVTLVDIRNRTVPPLEGFDAVIVGGSIYFGQVQSEVLNYVKDHQAELEDKRIGFFLCAGHPDEQVREKELASAFPEELLCKAKCVGIFGYEYDFKKLSWFEKLIIRIVAKVEKSQYELSEASIARFAASFSAQ